MKLNQRGQWGSAIARFNLCAAGALWTTMLFKSALIPVELENAPFVITVLLLLANAVIVVLRLRLASGLVAMLPFLAVGGAAVVRAVREGELVAGSVGFSGT